MNRILRLSYLAAAVLATVSFGPVPSAEGAKKTTQLQVISAYSDLADLALNAPVVAETTIKKAVRLREKVSPGIPRGHARFLVTAQIMRLVSSTRSMPSNISYLVDVPFDSRGKPPKFKGDRSFLFLKPAGRRPDQFVLTTRHSQIAWTSGADQMIRSILTEARESANQFQITGIGNAFHVRGTVPGESETQIFLATADRRPVSLSVLRRPGAVPFWSVSLGEMIDESSSPPGRNTLLWYRLACFLPSQMPESAFADTAADDRAAVIADYAFVMQQLGACGRQLRIGSQ